MRAAAAQVTSRVEFIEGAAIAGRLGNVRAANVVLLGALSALLAREGLAPELGPALAPALAAEAWLAVIAQRVPAKYLALNQQAFQAGREAALQQVASS